MNSLTLTHTSQPAKKVLMIAYIFPPLGGSGVQRTLKFVKYLPQLGWQPIVVCGDTEGFFTVGRDATFLNEIPPEAIVCRRPFISAYGLRRWAKGKLGFSKNDHGTVVQGTQNQVFSPIEVAAAPTEVVQKPFHRRIMGAFAKVAEPIEKPLIDPAFYWALSIVPLCRRLIEKHDIDVIYSTSFPYSDHLTGLLVKKLTGKPWVADFRDPWSLNACARHTGIRRKADVFVERQVVQQADKIIAATPPYTQDFRELAPNRASGDFVTITNGYDEIDFKQFADQGSTMSVPWQNGDQEKTTIAYVGYVFPESAIPFLSALGRLEDEIARRLRVVFIGGLAVPDMQWLQDHPVSVELQFTRRVVHAQAINAMQSADAILLLVGDGPDWWGHYPGKLFEYMRCGTPILACGPDGASAQLVRESGAGCIVSTDDIGGTADAIRLLVADSESFRSRYYRINKAVVSRYERFALTRQLARIFDEQLNKI